MPVGTSIVTNYYAPRTTFEGHLRIGPAGVRAGSGGFSYLLTGIVGDITIGFTPESNDVTPRNSFVKMFQAGMADMSITFEYNWSATQPGAGQNPAPPSADPALGVTAPASGPLVGDPALQYLQAAFQLGQAIAVRGTDTYAGQGPDMDMIITKFDKKEPKGKQQTVEVELKPAIGYRDPNLGIYV